MTSLNGKVALVTGGARGIGKAIVQTLSDSGAAVAFTYKSSSTAAAEITRPSASLTPAMRPLLMTRSSASASIT